MNVVKLESRSFSGGDEIPAKHTCEGKDLSPPLRWSDGPERTQSWALVCDDPDAPIKTWVHWVIYDLAPPTRELPEGVAAAPEVAGGARQGKNDFGRLGYGGPCPPRGKPHRYVFRIYALDRKLGIPSGATRDQVLRAMEGHVLARGELVGTFARS